MTTDKLDAATRQASSQLRRWCPIAETHQDLDQVACGWDHALPYDGPFGSHNLRKRRMLICSVCQQGEFTQKEFDEHECYSAY